MNRRRFLAASGGAIAVGTIGALGYFRFYGARTSSATDVVLSPGEEGMLTISWEGVKAIGYRELPDSDGIEIGISDVELSPPPDMGSDAFPPSYHWREPTAVEMTIPVRVTDDVAPGDYHLVLGAKGLVGLIEEPSHTLTVTVTDS
jgi:hypothetical protein